MKHSSVPIDAPSDTPKKTPTQAPKPEPEPKVASKPARAEYVKLRPAEKPADKPAEKPSEKPAPQAPKAAPAGSSVTKVQPATDDTTVLRKVEGTAEGKAEPIAKQKLSQPDDTNEIRTVDAPEPQQAQREDEELFDGPAAEYDTDYEVEEASVNPILLVLLVFFGVLLGVLGFLAFKWLWANTMAIVAALVGVGAVAAVVAAVGAMAGSRDKVTMIIAGLAAAVVAFGPALL